MPGLMFDSDEPAVLLSLACAGCRIATYADLVTPAILAAAGHRLVVIDRGSGDPHGVATVADIEPGCLTVAEGAAKIRQWIAARRPYPTAYHDRAVQGEVTAALAGERYYTWDATLDGTMRVPGVNLAAIQIAPSAVVGFHADLSVVWDDSWHPQSGGPSPAAITAVRLAAGLVAAANGALGHAVTGLLHAVRRPGIPVRRVRGRDQQAGREEQQRQVHRLLYRPVNRSGLPAAGPPRRDVPKVGPQPVGRHGRRAGHSRYQRNHRER
jgi:hypothetical protein